MHLSISTSLFVTTALFLVTSLTAQAQDTPIEPPPPQAGQTVNILYSDEGNAEIAAEDIPFNTCFATENAFANYAYLTFAPKNATINFYKDSNCQEFTFGLDGYYGGYPGPARSLVWVGWTEDYLGVLFNKNPIHGQGDAANGRYTTSPTPGSGHQPQPINVGQPDNDTKSSTSFFGVALGTIAVLAIGGIIFWKTAGKKMVEDNKGKSVLPYNRVQNDGDDDILLTTKSRSHNSFELADQDEDSEDEGEDNRDVIREHSQQKGQHSGQQDRYQDDDQV
ncbi:hypothetical protein BGX27_008735 [Mortierella sp. AM989]|nr:hypothetical protein BGX27_008735 [Mortierella sp. AM989]